MRPVVIIFAKRPRPGAVKSRLIPAISAEAAARLHHAMVDDLIHRLLDSPRGFDLELHTDGASDEWPYSAVEQRLQCGGDLGERMLFALESALAPGRPRAMILGSDSPTVPVAHLAALLQMDVDVALGPCDDGGFYAISCRKVHPHMVAGVAWSTGSTLEQTVAAIERCGLTAALGPEWYDVDTPADLPRLLADSEIGPATRRALTESR